MKRILILIFLLIASPSPVFAQEQIALTTGIQAVVGAVAAEEACGIQDTGTGAAGSAYVGYDDTEDRVYIAVQFTASGAGTYSIKTGYLNAKRNGTGTTVTAYLCPNNAGDPAADASCTVADSTLDCGTLTTSFAQVKFNWTAGYSLTNAESHWIKLKGSTVSATNFCIFEYNTAGTRSYERSADDSSWTVVDALADWEFDLSTCLE